jgi:hypothetical protein
LLIHHTEAIGAAVVMAFHKRNKIGLYLKKGLGFFLKKSRFQEKSAQRLLGPKGFPFSKRRKAFLFLYFESDHPSKKKY